MYRKRALCSGKPSDDPEFTIGTMPTAVAYYICLKRLTQKVSDVCTYLKKIVCWLLNVPATC